ncbi:thiol-disulfide oxidoreductase DCC family protein [Evansella sp. AB-P1]|uniref:thiol-disulfide oxidoreductase DCC family protein n=1 Tax=Evansella sp. AB-P1 TaxID=3037653 RepID=UPI00241E2CCE|nr:thiol-disulfide oxidoreductase DCC family protein [Evansella sp. AB-P1]MDG5786877.1 thiol-disulfide oxidoreductase DCC family protein [Evansella sp. AB-P1]
MNGIIMFDGVCNFCVGSIQFIIKREPHAYFQFASIQSKAGEKLFNDFSIPEDIDSLILIENNKYYLKSTAALRICRHLNWNWKLLYLFIVVPRPIRDSVYSIIAKKRYHWFGKRESCMMPTPELKNRFLS